MAADSQREAPGERSFRECSAERDGPSHPVEHRQGLRQMTMHRLCAAALIGALLSAPACRRMAGDAVAYKDEIPRPEEPLITQVPVVGRYGGRFVLGATNNPRTFNAMMASETSSTNITDRLFGFLVGFNLATQQFEPGLAKSWDVSS